MLKKILIICDEFPPGFGPRMGYISKYLLKYNWQVFVVSPLYENNTNHLIDLVPISVNVTHIFVSSDDISTFGKRKIRRFARAFIFGPFVKGTHTITNMVNACKEIIEHNKINLILCSSSSLFPIPIAYKLSKVYSLPYMIDLRDIYEQYPADKNICMRISFNILRYRRNYFLRKASALTTISKWHLTILKKINPNSHLIYNGFDPELFFTIEMPKNKVFQIKYTGTISTGGIGMRDPNMLFNTIKSLHKANIISPQTFRIQFYTNSYTAELISSLSKQYEIFEYFEVFAPVPVKEVPQILATADILLILANKSSNKGPKGIITTKIFEYMAMKKPILCIPSDDSFIKDMIITANVGFAAENQEAAYEYIKNKYEEWKNDIPSSFSPDMDYINSYSRISQAEDFSNLFNKILS
ncbi:MAG: hypothetical protein LBT51_09065 [Fusobacteriaceae bacterium]|jgi:glycosyltransferase involved in cell wall biosynthesis|nr:hypothetical protein [Fusobacteriaceae bacterium]